jgi:hypothetical protein
MAQAFLRFSEKKFVNSEKCLTFASELLDRVAQMAESVDALVSNTSGAIRAGSTPALGTRKQPSVITITLGCFFEPHSPTRRKGKAHQ